MRILLRTVVTCALLGLVVAPARAQEAQNPFPLAGPAGKDSNARQVAPPGSVNQGPFDNATWKCGNAFNAPAELGELHNTQAKPEVGPYAPK